MNSILVILLLTIIATTSQAIQQNCETGSYIDKLNYGVIAKCVKRVDITTGYWTQIFHFPLPTIPSRVVTRTDNSCNGSANAAECHKKKKVYDVLQGLTVTLQESIGDLVNEVKEIVPDIGNTTSQSRRARRGLIDAIGHASKWLFGTATMADIDDIRQTVTAILDQTESSANEIQRTRNGIATFLNMTNSRLDTLHDTLMLEHRTQLQFHKQIDTVERAIFQEYDTMARLATELAQYTKTHDDLLSFQRAMNDLAKGSLSSHLIEKDTIHHILSRVTRYMRRQRWRLLIKTDNEIYSQCPFDYARSGNTIIVRLHIPYTTFAPLDILKIHTFPIPMPGSQGLTSHIQQLPKYILFSAENIATIDILPQFHIVDDRDVEWHYDTETSCVHALLSDNIDSVRNICKFSVTRQRIPKTVLHLTDNLILVTGFERTKVICNFQTMRNLTNHACHLCVIRLRCGCSVHEGNGPARWTNTKCHKGELNHTSIVHNINLVALQTFYDTTNATLSASELYTSNELRQIEDLNFTLFEDKANHLLTWDEQASHSLKKLAIAMKNDTAIFHSPTEAILYDLMHQTPTIPTGIQWDIQTYAIIALAGLYILLLIFLLQTRRHINYRLVELAGLTAIPGVRAHESIWRIKTTTPDITNLAMTLPLTNATTKSIVEILYQEIYIVDLAFFTLMILLTIAFTIALVCIYKKAVSRRSTIYLQLKAGSLISIIKWTNLPDSTHYYATHFSPRKFRMELSDYKLFGMVILSTEALKVTSTLTGNEVILPSRIVVTKKVLKLIQTINGKSGMTVAPVLVHSHHAIFPVTENRQP